MGILSDPIDFDGARKRPRWPNQPATTGLRVRHRTTGVVGDVRRFNERQVTLVDLTGREQVLPVANGAFSVGGKTVNLVRPKPQQQNTQPSVTASGSLSDPDKKARIAVPSRILVEGIHDAELVEKIWGDDLRGEGVVVEPLHGADDLGATIEAFAPSAERRLGILLDHLVDHTKESHIAAAVRQPHVLIRGHDFVDVWEAIRPSVVGIDAWPTVPKGQDWKTGVCEALGFGGTSGELWRVLLSRVSSYRDLEPSLVGAVEELIDFVAPPPN